MGVCCVRGMVSRTVGVIDGALAGIFVQSISNPGRCRSVKLRLLTGQHTDLYTTRATEGGPGPGDFKLGMALWKQIWNSEKQESIFSRCAPVAFGAGGRSNPLV